MRRLRQSGPWRAALAVGFGIAWAAAPGFAGELFYEIEGGTLVITDTPAAPTARPLPGAGRAAIRKAAKVSSSSSPWDPYFTLAAEEAGLSPHLVKAVARVESGFDPRAVSPKGAQGMMQLMPATARDYGVSDPFDAWQNLRAGARHLRGLLDRFGDLDLALAAYNAGAGAVERHGGIPAYAETREYVRRVRQNLGDEWHAPVTPRAASRDSVAPVRMVRSADGSLLLAN